MKEKKEQQHTPEETDNENIDSKIDLIKYSLKVKSNINKVITTDFVLAKLDPQDREGITEMVHNAYLAKKIVLLIKKQSLQQKLINKQQEQQINEYAQIVFDSFMTRIYMIAILHRNVENNTLIRILAGLEEEQTPEDNNQIIDKLKNALQPQTT